MADRRMRNIDWNVADEQGSVYGSTNASVVAVLMDLRDELRVLNSVFRCHNAVAIPELLRAIEKNTTKRKRAASGRRG